MGQKNRYLGRWEIMKAENGMPVLSKFRCILYESTEDIIIQIIKSHKDFSNTINQNEIADEYMLKRNEPITTRRVRRIIEELIKNGSPIISTPHEPGGYCWGGKENEALECYRRLRKKGIKILLRARRILKNSKRGQQKLF